MDVRHGTNADVPALVEIMFAAPSRELVAVIESVDRARRFQRALFESALRRPGCAVFVAEEDARARGASRLSLTTSGTNPARHLYERNGYRLAGQRSHPASRGSPASTRASCS